MRKDSGFTLIELLIVVAIIGIIAAIAIPNLLNAIDRSKQKRTMADIRSIGTACEEYSIDNNFYPAQASGNVSGITGTLEPMYIKVTPVKDGWNYNILYAQGNTSEYTITSPGKNGTTSSFSGQTTDFDCDIVFSVGQFTAWPQGVQN